MGRWVPLAALARTSQGSAFCLLQGGWEHGGAVRLLLSWSETLAEPPGGLKGRALLPKQNQQGAQAIVPPPSLGASRFFSPPPPFKQDLLQHRFLGPSEDLRIPAPSICWAGGKWVHTHSRHTEHSSCSL